jgi:hypothetical protein
MLRLKKRLPAPYERFGIELLIAITNPSRLICSRLLSFVTAATCGPFPKGTSVLPGGALVIRNQWWSIRQWRRQEQVCRWVTHEEAP